MFASVSCPTELRVDASPKIRRILGEVGGGGFCAPPAHKLPPWKGEEPSKTSGRMARAVWRPARSEARSQKIDPSLQGDNLVDAKNSPHRSSNKHPFRECPHRKDVMLSAAKHLT